ncbi:MAG TPA: HAMP domain-containing sensor histidine kinase, partial [Vicinamibacterales bacterium]|nr:HAMP domain-containing sensor histidine kinase [Vicinamibacterales bacterium]
MLDSRTLRVAAALVDPARRRPAARDLASALGAADLLLLVRDAGTDAFVPAPAFPPTLPGGPAWRDLLERLLQAGVHHARVGYPEADPPLPALAYAERDVALVLLGGRPDAAAVDVLRDLAPLLAAVLRAEHEALAARGELKVAQEHARHTETLARALDSARAEVERSMIALGRQARELEEARARAEEATRAKDAFLAMLGHELRNPLSPMLTAIQLLRLKDRGSRELDVIERQVQSLMRLVDDLLDISRITRGRIELRKQRIELADVAARAIEMAGPVLEQNRQVLAVQIPPRGCLVDADPARLAQVFANLLTNAAKYSDPDTEILFAAEQDEAHVRIRVRDRGIGIDPAMLERVFEPFVQHRQALDRSQGGLGLGLAIARSLVALHGGTITAHSEGEGRGSEFVVELPRPRAEA